MEMKVFYRFCLISIFSLRKAILFRKLILYVRVVLYKLLYKLNKSSRYVFALKLMHCQYVTVFKNILQMLWYVIASQPIFC